MTALDSYDRTDLPCHLEKPLELRDLFGGLCKVLKISPFGRNDNAEFI